MKAGLRSLLPRTFTAFFHRFPRPTAVQAEGILPILEGRNILLCAPTASGKTEAYAAPLGERLLSEKWGPLGLLLVSPTRALANDLKRRLDAPMGNSGIRLGRYTGEHKEKRGGAFPEAVVTTPEALDSLLARRPKEMSGVRAVVLDEIHVLDGTPRGDQLRILLHRLQALAEGNLQAVGASATVPDPRGIAARYGLSGGVVHAGERRRIRARRFDGASIPHVAAHLETLAAAGFRKILVFCNSREAVETYASDLKGLTIFGDKIFAHHGSLAKGSREGTERRFLESGAAVCFATLTLELGIDVGTVDYVLLMDPPPSVANLLQRMGRGSRRSRDLRVGYVCRGKRERVLFRTLLELASRGEWASAPYAFRPGVLLQQALVLAGSRGYVEAGSLAGILPPSIRKEQGERILREILESAAEGGLLEETGGGRFVLSEKSDRLYSRGILHSNFSSGPGLPVVDRLTGEVVGSATPPEEADLEDLRIGGSTRRFVSLKEGRILTDSGGSRPKARFPAEPAPFTSLAFGRAVAERLGAGEGEILQAKGEKGWILLHGLGSVGGELLAWLVRFQIGEGNVARTTPYTLSMGRPLGRLPQAERKEITRFLGKKEKRLSHRLEMGAFHKHLPRDLRRRSIYRAAWLEGVEAFLARARLETLRKAAPPEWEVL